MLLRVSYSAGHPLDAAIALELGKQSGLVFSAWPLKKTMLDAEKWFLNVVSCYFGEWYLYDVPLSRNKVEGLINLYGAFGEICCRLYYSRRRFYDHGDFQSIDQMVKLLANTGLSTNRIKSSVLMEAWEREMNRELDSLPGRSPAEKRDLHYLYYRNGLHFKKEFSADIENIYWGPIQSKTMFLLKMQSFYIFPELKLQIDLLELLNSKLADFEFELNMDNIARAKLHKEFRALRSSFNPNKPNNNAKELCDQFRDQLNQLTEITNSDVEKQGLNIKSHAFDKRRKLWFLWALEKVLDVCGDELGKEGRIVVQKWIDERILGEQSISEKNIILIKYCIWAF